MNETALITGCTRGIGLELAHEFARHGHPLILVAEDANELARLSTELISAHGITLHAIPADLEAAGAEEELFQRVGAYGLVVEILVNHASRGIRGKSWELGIEQDLAMVRLNIEAMLRLTKLCLPPMIAHGRGRILYTASGPDHEAGALPNLYQATKAFVRSYSENLAAELKDSGVTVTTLCAGPMECDLSNEDEGGEAGAESKAEADAGSLPNPTSPRQVAEAAYQALRAGERIARPDAAGSEGKPAPSTIS